MIDEFLKIEEKYDLFNEKIGDFYFWHYIRFGIYREIERQLGYIDAVVVTKKKRKAISVANKLMFRSLEHYKKNSDFFITCTTNHRTKYGKYYTIYIDQLVKSFKDKKTFVVIELRPTYYNKSEYEIDNVYSVLGLDIQIKLHKLIIKNTKPIAFSKNLEKAVNELNDRFLCNVEYELLEKSIQNSYIRWKLGKRYFKKALENIKPKGIIEVCSYGIDNMIINEIAKEMNIPTIELQHGIMGEGHIAYNFLKKQKLAAFPDYVFTYSEFWNHTTRFPIEEDKIIATGFPHLEEIVKKSKYSNKNNKVKNILVISQWTTAKKLSEFAVELYEHLKKTYNGEFSVVYKMHPGETLTNMECFEKLNQYKDKIEIVEHNEKSLYDCFFDADVQVGVSSTGIYEGLAFGLKTYLLKVDSSERLQALVDNGYAKYVQHPWEVDVEKVSVTNSENSTFWKENALDNILENIDKIMKEA